MPPKKPARRRSPRKSPRKGEIKKKKGDDHTEGTELETQTVSTCTAQGAQGGVLSSDTSGGGGDAIDIIVEAQIHSEPRSESVAGEADTDTDSLHSHSSVRGRPKEKEKAGGKAPGKAGKAGGKAGKAGGKAGKAPGKKGPAATASGEHLQEEEEEESQAEEAEILELGEILDFYEAHPHHYDLSRREYKDDKRKERELTVLAQSLGEDWTGE